MSSDPSPLHAEPGLDEAPTASKPTLARALWRTARPRQWLKNGLVAAAAAAAGILHEPAVLAQVAVAFTVFCLCSSAVYFFNDWRDAAADRVHPVKKHRPVAAGHLQPGLAVAAGTVLFALGLTLSVSLLPLAFVAALSGYVVLMLAYSVWLKHVPLLDVAVVASGFVIRAVAGGLAVSVPLSEWFLIVASFGALFMVTGRRQAEVMSLGPAGRAHRSTLEAYTPDFVQHLLSVSASVTIVAYCLWAFLTQEADGGGPWLAISVIPFVLALLRYALLSTRGEGGEPEEVVLADRGLQGVGVVWVALLVLGLYAA